MYELFKESFGREFELYLKINNGDLSVASIQLNEANYSNLKLRNFMNDVI